MELLDLYNINGGKLNKTIVRGEKNYLEGEYIKLAVIWIECKGKYLVQKCSQSKGGEYAITGGHVPAGVTSLDQIVIEVEEELGVKINKDSLRFLGSIAPKRAIFDVYLLQDDNFDTYNLTLQQEEVEDVLFLTKQEIEQLISEGTFRKSSCSHYEKFIK